MNTLDLFQSSFSSSNKLCFEPNEFYLESFSIDEFIQRKRQVVPLDILRDDLGLYLKTLRSALIELINQDYGQFVNLSSNLVGLDSQIYNITKPLKFIQRDLEVLGERLQATLDALYSQLNDKKTFHEIKTNLQYQRLASATLESAEHYMRQLSTSWSTNVTTTSVSNHTFRCLQLLCDEVAQVQFLLEKCGKSAVKNDDLSLVQEMQSRHELCASFVYDKLEYLLSTFGNSTLGDSKQEELESKVKSVLHLYSELKQERKAEEIFITNILKPKCTEILSRKGNIIALLEEIEVFLTVCPVLIISRQIEGWPWLAHYNFITNGVFPYIIHIFIKQFPHIWSPSNPDQFFTNWKRFELFIQKVEDSLPSTEHLRQFRSSTILTEFVSKWQFHVYFQLRFHNLAIEFESALDYLVTSLCATSDFKLDATRILVKVVKQCSDNEKIFLTQLAGRFLKASALFIARFLKQISSSISSISSDEQGDSKGSSSSVASASASASTKQQQESSSTVKKIQQLISIYYDVNLSELVLGQILHENIKTIISSQCKPLDDHNSQRNFEENFRDESSKTKTEGNFSTAPEEFLAQFPWNSTKQSIETNLIEIILSQTIVHLNAVNEVPRLYRRTNRDVPTTHSDYIDAILEPLKSFESIISSNYESHHQKNELWTHVVGNVGAHFAQRYANQVQEVLTSVQRMEESLKRLKKVKAGGGGGGAINDTKLINNSVNNNTKLSDDDKIRRQLQIDVEYLIVKVKSLSSTIDTNPLQNLVFT